MAADIKLKKERELDLRFKCFNPTRFQTNFPLLVTELLSLIYHNR